MKRLVIALVLAAGPALAQSVAGIAIHTYPIAPFPVMPSRAAVAVVSTATPALSGTYGIAASDIANITNIETGINAGGGFPGGGTTLTYLDTAGAPHTFPTTAEFTAFAVAIENYVYAKSLVAAGQSATVPTVPLSIP